MVTSVGISYISLVRRTKYELSSASGHGEGVVKQHLDCVRASHLELRRRKLSLEKHLHDLRRNIEKEKSQMGLIGFLRMAKINHNLQKNKNWDWLAWVNELDGEANNVSIPISEHGLFIIDNEKPIVVLFNAHCKLCY